MSASIIQPNALNPAPRELFPQSESRRRRPSHPAATQETPNAAISDRGNLARVNTQNRLYDLFAGFIALFFVFCICVAMVATGGWVVYELLAEMNSWSSADLIDVIKNSNL